MPGVNILVDLQGGLAGKREFLTELQRSLRYDDSYFSGVRGFDRTCFVGFCAYESYPVVFLENSEFTILVEGAVYDRTKETVGKELQQLAEGIFFGGKDPARTVREWLLGVDGDFVVVVRDRTSGDLLIFNDCLARLPLYVHRDAGRMVVSREIRFLENVVPGIQPDPVGIRQFLLFGYPLGQRTLLRDVCQVLPGTLIRVRPAEGCITLEALQPLDFGQREHGKGSIRTRARDLADLFVAALKDRVRTLDGYHPLVCLSGGLDSRAVGAGLSKAGIDFSCASYLDAAGRADRDVAVARRVAERLGVPWRVFSVGPPTGEDHLRLLRAKAGLNDLGLSFLLPFLGEMVRAYGGRSLCFTGDGGDRIKPHFKSGIRLESQEDLLRHVLLKNQIFSPEEISRLTGAPESEIVEDLRSTLLAYPEREYNDRYIHFLICESAFKYVFDGEDRNRYYLWSLTPFYSLPFFRYAMSCPDGQKRYFRLYRRFLQELSPGICAVENVDWGAPLTRWASLSLFAYQALPSGLKNLARSRIQKAPAGGPGHAVGRACLLEQVRESPAVRAVFSRSELGKRVEAGMDGKRFSTLFTLVSFLELLGRQESTLTRYRDAEFA